MPPRPCLDCGQLTAKGSRCKPCEAQRQHTRNTTRTHYQGDWSTTSQRIRTQWVTTHGWVCPGWHRPTHPSHDLVVDHVTARSRHALAVLCRSCNSRKSATER
jgi:5-methylcytosine-specific restriction protein A